jgi:hypothetical protein
MLILWKLGSSFEIKIKIMRYLNKFVEYIKESNGRKLDLDLVENEYLVPINNLSWGDTYISVITEVSFGYQLVNIRFHTSGFNKVDNDDRSPLWQRWIVFFRWVAYV